MSEQKDIQVFLRQLQQRGYDVLRGGGGHWHIRRDGKLIAVAANSPNGGRRGLHNLRAIIARYERQGREDDEHIGDL